MIIVIMAAFDNEVPM